MKTGLMASTEIFGCECVCACLEIQFFLKKKKKQNQTNTILHCALQCKQPKLQPFHSSTHVLTGTSSHVFMYSRLYQKLPSRAAIFYAHNNE